MNKINQFSLRENTYKYAIIDFIENNYSKHIDFSYFKEKFPNMDDNSLISFTKNKALELIKEINEDLLINVFNENSKKIFNKDYSKLNMKEIEEYFIKIQTDKEIQFSFNQVYNDFFNKCVKTLETYSWESDLEGVYKIGIDMVKHTQKNFNIDEFFGKYLNVEFISYEDVKHKNLGYDIEEQIKKIINYDKNNKKRFVMI